MPTSLHLKRRRHHAMNPQQHHRPLFHHEEGYNLPNVHPSPSSPPPPPPPGSWMYIQMVWAIYSHSVPCILGNMLEWLDFGIYGYSQAELSKALFHDSITMGWIAFGLGYSVRPLGAHVLGKLADRTSRTMSFSIAILGMAGATAGLALLPAVCEENSDRDTGWWTHHYCVSTVYLSAIPAILLRCVQGFSAGASAGGVNVIQSENGSSSPSQSVGVNNVSGAAASMLSAGLVYGLRALLGEDAYAVWGWRLAFGLVIPPSLLAACLLASDVHDMHGGVRLLSSTNEYELASQMVVGQQLDCVDSHRGFQDESTLCQDDESGVPTPFSTASQHDKTSSSALAPSALAPSMVSMWSVMTVSVFIQFAIASYNNLNIYLVQYDNGVRV